LHKQKQNGNQQGRSNVDKSFASRERLRFNPVDYDIWGRLQERVYHSIVHDINHLMERLIEEWCDLDHNIICAAVNQWRTRLRECCRRALWASVVTATASVTDIYRLNWYQRCSSCWKLAFWVLVLKIKTITTQETQFIEI